MMIPTAHNEGVNFVRGFAKVFATIEGKIKAAHFCMNGCLSSKTRETLRNRRETWNPRKSRPR
jgi:hypothetical protein